MTACYSAHPRHRWNWWRYWAWCQIDYSFTIWSRTRNSLRWILTYKQTIAWTSHIFFSWRCISNWLRKFKIIKNMLMTLKQIKFRGWTEHTVASWHWLHLTTCCSFLLEISIIAAQTRHVTIGTPPLGVFENGGGTSPGPIGDTVVWSSAPKTSHWQNKN